MARIHYNITDFSDYFPLSESNRTKKEELVKAIEPDFLIDLIGREKAIDYIKNAIIDGWDLEQIDKLIRKAKIMKIKKILKNGL